MIGSSKNSTENYPRKCFWTQGKETQVKFNPGLSANWPSNNWAQVYKWVPVTYCWGNPAMDQHPVKGGVEILLAFSCLWNWNKLWPFGPLARECLYLTLRLYSDNNYTNICKQAIRKWLQPIIILIYFNTNRITPRLHKSHLLSYVVACVLKASTTSGAMYSAEPTYRK